MNIFAINRKTPLTTVTLKFHYDFFLSVSKLASFPLVLHVF